MDGEGTPISGDEVAGPQPVLDPVERIERDCAELVGRLREIDELIAEFREAIDTAAWFAADPARLSEAQAHELARTLASIAGIEDEIEDHLAGRCADIDRPQRPPAPRLQLLTPQGGNSDA